MSSFDDYTTLQATLLDWLVRKDLAGSVVQSFIAMFEADANTRLRTHWQETTISFNIAGEFTALPADHAGTRSLSTTAGRIWPLRYLTPGQMAEEFPSGVAGPVSAYTISGGQYRVLQPPASPMAARLVYWRRIPSLAVAQTNWLLQNYPAAYLYGSLKHSAPYLKGDERLSTWQALSDEMIGNDNMLGQINKDSDRAQFGGPLIMSNLHGNPQDGRCYP